MRHNATTKPLYSGPHQVQLSLAGPEDLGHGPSKMYPEICLKKVLIEQLQILLFICNFQIYLFE